MNDSFIPEGVFSERKIVVTGIYGSGKTTYALEYTKRVKGNFINFDANFCYETPGSDAIFLAKLPEAFVIDAIPWDPKTQSTELFKKYARENDVKIICCVCANFDAWMYRLLVRKGLEMSDERINHYVVYYNKILRQYLDLNIVFYDTIGNKYITEAEMYEKLKWMEQYYKP